MKKGFISFIILFIFSAVVFFIGWIQFSIPAGMFGVMISKTGGINALPIIPGEFRWQWEKLLPTNVKILTFNLAPQSFQIPVTGALPSADIYSTLLNNPPDFSYIMTTDITLSIKPDTLSTLVKTQNITTQEKLDTYLRTQAQNIGQAAVSYIISSTINDPALDIIFTNTTKDLLLDISAPEYFPDLVITLLAVNVERIPDIALYNTAKEFYLSYYQQTKEVILAEASEQAKASSADYFQIEKFARWGKILTAYPILIDFFAVSGKDPIAVFSILDLIKQSKSN